MNLNSTIRRLLLGFILVILPIVLLLFVFHKVKKLVQDQILPLESHLPGEKFLGFGLISLISVVLILLISYLAGVLIESKRMRSYFTVLEKKVLVFIPGYLVIKSKFTDSSVSDDDQRKVVLVNENDQWKFGIEIERNPDSYCIIFLPFPPDAKSGELKLVHESKLRALDMKIGKLVSLLRHYGQGGSALIK